MRNAEQTYNGTKLMRLFFAPKSKLESVLTVLLAAYLSFALVMGYKVSMLQSCTIGPKSAAAFVCVAALAYVALMTLWRTADSLAAKRTSASTRSKAFVQGRTQSAAHAAVTFRERE